MPKPLGSGFPAKMGAPELQRRRLPATIRSPRNNGETGVQTFTVNQHGVVYEVDLGPTTTEIVKIHRPIQSRIRLELTVTSPDID